MNGISLLLAALALGVDYGWQPTNDGQLEYIVQIEPVTLIALREGQEIISQIDPQVRYVRRFRIRVGTDMVPRRGNPPQQPVRTGLTTATLPQMPGVQFGWQPMDREQLEFIVQMAPDRMTTLRTGEDIVGEIPADLPNVARLRILVGANAVPRQGFQIPAAAGPTLGTPQPVDRPPAMMLPGPTTTTTASPPATYPAPGTAATSGTGVPPTTPLTAPSAWPTPAASGGPWGAVQPTTVPARDSSSTLLDPARQGYPQSPYRPAADPTRPAPATSGWTTTDPRYSVFPSLAGQLPPTQPLYDPHTTPREGAYTSYPPATTPAYGQPAAAAPWGATTDRTVPPSYGQPAGTPTTPGFQTADGSQPPGRAGWSTTPTYPSVSDQQRAADASRTAPSKGTWADWAQPPRDPSGKPPLARTDPELARDRPWGALTVAVLLLFASIGGNLYLGWIAARIYRLYLDLADELEEKERNPQPASETSAEDRYQQRRRRRRAILGV